MTEDEKTGLIATLPPRVRSVYATISERGRVRRIDLPIGGSTTAPLQKLCELGLIRVVGKEKLPGRGDTAVFAAVPAAEVEAVAEGYKSKRRKRRSSGTRAFEYENKARTGGLLSEWYDGRRNMIILQDALRKRIMPMVFQENVPADEIKRYKDDLKEFRELIVQAELALEERMKEDGLRASIEKLERMADPDGGASEPEMERARKHASRRRAQLEERTAS